MRHQRAVLMVYLHASYHPHASFHRYASKLYQHVGYPHEGKRRESLRSLNAFDYYQHVDKRLGHNHQDGYRQHQREDMSQKHRHHRENRQHQREDMSQPRTHRHENRPEKYNRRALFRHCED
jgi:hypothetical protein